MQAIPEIASPVVRLRGISVDYSGRAALTRLDLDVPAATVTVIAGPNGAGKSTLLEIIAGIRSPTAGSRETHASVAFVPQRSAIPDRLPVTVRDVVAVGAWGRRGSLRRIDAGGRAAIAEALERLRLSELADRPFAELSGGQRQRALLAQGLARQADLLLLDEPTTGLDADSAARIRTVVRAEAQRGTAMVCVSHDPAVIAMADELVQLASGRRAQPPTHQATTTVPS